MEGGTRNAPTLEQAVRYFCQQTGSDYTEAEVRAGWLTFTATAQDGVWFWGNRPVGDWRAALEARMASMRPKAERAGSEKNAGGESVKQQIFKLDKHLSELEAQIEAFSEYDLETAARLKAERKTLTARRAQLAEVGA